MRAFSSRAWSFLALASAALASVACNEASSGCDPTDPLCAGGGPAVASVTVTSSIDTVVVIGGPEATLSAEARDASAQAIGGLTWSWSSLHATIASVDPATGIVTAIAPGTATIRAQQNNNSQTGEIRMRAVDADLAAIGSTLDDSFVVVLQSALGATPQGLVNSLRPACTDGVASGNVLAIDGCLSSLIAVGGTGTDEVLLHLLDLFYTHAQGQLEL